MHYKLTLLVFILFFQLLTPAFANYNDMAPIPLTGGTVSPNQILRIELEKALILKRYYKITCDIENSNFTSIDLVVMSLTGAWTHNNTGATGGVGKITLNGHELVHSQGMLDRFDNKYVASDVWIGSLPVNSPGLHLELRFENYHAQNSVTVKNCYADYMVD